MPVMLLQGPSPNQRRTEHTKSILHSQLSESTACVRGEELNTQQKAQSKAFL